MTQELINIGGQANDGTGDSIREAFDKVNKNFTEVYNMEVDLTPLENRIEQSEVEIGSLKTRVSTSEGNITSLGTRVSTAEGNITNLGTRLTTAEGEIDTLDARVYLDIDSSLAVVGLRNPSINRVIFDPNALSIKTGVTTLGFAQSLEPFSVANGAVVLNPDISNMVATTNIQSRAVTDVYTNTVFFDQVGPTTVQTFTVSISGIPIPAGGKLLSLINGVTYRTPSGDIDANTLILPGTPTITNVSETGSYTTTGSITLTRPDQIFKVDLTLTVIVLKR
jgi:hypothetical protein